MPLGGENRPHVRGDVVLGGPPVKVNTHHKRCGGLKTSGGGITQTFTSLGFRFKSHLPVDACTSKRCAGTSKRCTGVMAKSRHEECQSPYLSVWSITHALAYQASGKATCFEEIRRCSLAPSASNIQRMVLHVSKRYTGVNSAPTHRRDAAQGRGSG